MGNKPVKWANRIHVHKSPVRRDVNEWLTIGKPYAPFTLKIFCIGVLMINSLLWAVVKSPLQGNIFRSYPVTLLLWAVVGRPLQDKTKYSDRIPYLPSYERSLVALYKTKYSDRIRYLLSLFSPVAIKKSFNRSITMPHLYNFVFVYMFSSWIYYSWNFD